ncbi:MAG: altronate dehydratase family protein [Treponema sp.]|nr:altronate dehydratase family protein [Treponema sp.]
MKIIRINSTDTVAVALESLAKGESVVVEGKTLVCLEDIPRGHKVALKNINKGEKVVKYGCVIGAAVQDILTGAHVHTHNLKTLLTETPVYHWTQPPVPAPYTSAPDIQAFRRKDGRIGVRNEIWIVPTVGCVNRTAQKLADWADAEFAERNVDGVFAWTHPYGCSQMGDDHETTRTALADLVKHPNAGAVLVVSLGCENNTLESFKSLLGEYAQDHERIRFLVTQESVDEIEDGKKLLMELAAHAEQVKREPITADKLVIGMKCGGSDGLSGVTANALVGLICDMLTEFGASVVLTEVPEMFGAEQMLMDRCENKELFDRTVRLIEDFKEYFRFYGQTVYENPSPGNKAGGVTTLEDKSCGCVQKSGSSIVRGVYRYGERVPLGTGGLVLLEGPGNDIVSTTAMTAAGVHLILFTTGRGTPLGAPVPTIKIASNSELAQKKPNWIDFDASRLLSEDAPALCAELLQLILDTACGKVQTKNELNDYREIAVFKNGVTL